MGGFTNAISNAIAARGNALAQGELQRGQVWGNLAANLGQIPGQAIAFHQQREAAMQNNELKKITIEKAQRTADREKRAIQIVNSGKPKDQIYAELKMLASEDPEDFLRFQNTESELAIKQQHLDLDIAQKDFTQRSGLPGTEFERPITPPANALAPGQMAPQVPVPQRQMEFERMVHPKNALGVRPPTDVDIRERTAATDALAMGKFAQQQDILETNRETLEGVKAANRADNPPNLLGEEKYAAQQAAEYRERTGKEPTRAQMIGWIEKYKLLGAEYRTAHPAARNPMRPRLVVTKDASGKTIQKWVTPQVGEEYDVGDTAEMRNKELARSLVGESISAIETLSKKVITEKTGIEQKAKAAGRSVEAYLANDPDYRVYQDARTALAGNLAVAQQGSRPSDADIRAIWLPLVPDVYRDTTDSAKMKWTLIRQLSHTGGSAPAASAAPAGGGGGLDPQKKARLEELRAKKAAGTLGK